MISYSATPTGTVWMRLLSKAIFRFFRIAIFGRSESPRPLKFRIDLKACPTRLRPRARMMVLRTSGIIFKDLFIVHSALGGLDFDRVLLSTSDSCLVDEEDLALLLKLTLMAWTRQLAICWTESNRCWLACCFKWFHRSVPMLSRIPEGVRMLKQMKQFQWCKMHRTGLRLDLCYDTILNRMIL